MSTWNTPSCCDDEGLWATIPGLPACPEDLALAGNGRQAGEERRIPPGEQGQGPRRGWQSLRFAVSPSLLAADASESGETAQPAEAQGTGGLTVDASAPAHAIIDRPSSSAPAGFEPEPAARDKQRSDPWGWEPSSPALTRVPVGADLQGDLLRAEEGADEAVSVFVPGPDESGGRLQMSAEPAGFDADRLTAGCPPASGAPSDAEMRGSAAREADADPWAWWDRYSASVSASASTPTGSQAQGRETAREGPVDPLERVPLRIVRPGECPADPGSPVDDQPDGATESPPESEGMLSDGFDGVSTIDAMRQWASQRPSGARRSRRILPIQAAGTAGSRNPAPGAEPPFDSLTLQRPALGFPPLATEPSPNPRGTSPGTTGVPVTSALPPLEASPAFGAVPASAAEEASGPAPENGEPGGAQPDNRRRWRLERLRRRQLQSDPFTFKWLDGGDWHPISGDSEPAVREAPGEDDSGVRPALLNDPAGQTAADGWEAPAASRSSGFELDATSLPNSSGEGFASAGRNDNAWGDADAGTAARDVPGFSALLAEMRSNRDWLQRRISQQAVELAEIRRLLAQQTRGPGEFEILFGKEGEDLIAEVFDGTDIVPEGVQRQWSSFQAEAWGSATAYQPGTAIRGAPANPGTGSSAA